MSGGQTVFAPALAAMERALAGGGPVIIAVDGRCGSGKTTLAALASSELGLSVAHMDDFYLPHGRRVPDWRTTPCANMDFDRLREQVLCPYRQGQPVLYRPYRCAEGVFGPTEVFPADRPLLVEGSYSHHPSLAGYYDLKIFLTCAAQEQRRRLRRREGDGFAGFRQIWIPLEEGYFQEYGVEKHALCIDTSALTRQEGARK